MRYRRLTFVGALATTLLTASIATGATAQLSIKPTKAIRSLGTNGSGLSGYQFNGRVVNPDFRIVLRDDRGAAVTGCLGDGARVRLIRTSDRVEVGSASCTSRDGAFHVYPRGRIAKPTGIVATVDASIHTGNQPISATVSNPIGVLISPQILNRSPLAVRTRTYPIRGKVVTPDPRRAGIVQLERKVGKRWRKLRVRPLPRSGAFIFRVASVGPYRVRFMARRKLGYVDSYLTLRVRRV